MGYLPPLPNKFKGAAAAALLMLAACGFFAVFGSHGLSHLWRLQRQQSEVEAIAYSLSRNNQELRDHLERLEHDDLYLERLARERLGWIKDGEFVYRTKVRPSR